MPRATCRNWQDRAAPAPAGRARRDGRRPRSAHPAARESSLPGSCAIRRRRTAACTAAVARSAATSADDSVNPPGRPSITLSAPTSALTSSEFGCTTTPWTDSSSDSSTKSCRLIRPRVGGGAVTTNSVSPASGSTSRCSAPGLASGTLTLANAGSVMLRTTISGSGGACTRSAKVSVQLVPIGRSSGFRARASAGG